MNQTPYFKPDDTLGETIDFSKVFGADMVERVREFKNSTTTPSIYPTIDGEPVPPGWRAKTASHHWLEKFDCDGHSGGLMVLQWNPAARRWSTSGNVGTGLYCNVTGWKYVAYCPMPGEDQ